MSTDNKDIIEISTLKLNLNGLIVELTPEQARVLWGKLNDFFGPDPAPWIYDFGRDYKPWVSPDYFGDRITCNAYTGNTLELR